jgi:hypothetical protein
MERRGERASLARMAAQPHQPRPSCPACGEPIGAYEPIWRIGPLTDAVRTSRLNLVHPPTPRESLWHAACAEADGVDGG